MIKTQIKLEKYLHIKVYNKNKGFGILEALIACALNIIIITIIYQTVINVKHNLVSYKESIYLQQSARSAIDIITDSFVNTAYSGCSNYTTNININKEYYNWMNHFDSGIFGVSNNSTELKTVDSKAKSDIIVFYMLDTDNSKEIINQDDTFLYLNSNSDYKPNDFLTIITPNCGKIFSFIASSKTTKNKIHINYNDVLKLNDCNVNNNLNCSKNLITLQALKKTGNKLYNQLGFAYYIKYSNNIPNLYRKKIGITKANRSYPSEPLIEGIEQLAILYQIKDENQYALYLTANQVTNVEQWSQVVAVYIEIVARSFTEVLSAPQTYFFQGIWNVPNDKYKREVYSTTIALRNKIL